jgi:hypothetical protein
VVIAILPNGAEVFVHSNATTPPPFFLSLRHNHRFSSVIFVMQGWFGL